MCGLLSSQSRPTEELKSSPTDLGDAPQDLRNAYHLIQMKEGDEYKTAFRTRYRQFVHPVVLFRFVNAPATLLPCYNTNQRRLVVGRATTYRERDDHTGTKIPI